MDQEKKGLDTTVVFRPVPALLNKHLEIMTLPRGNTDVADEAVTPRSTLYGVATVFVPLSRSTLPEHSHRRQW